MTNSLRYSDLESRIEGFLSSESDNLRNHYYLEEYPDRTFCQGLLIYGYELEHLQLWAQNRSGIDINSFLLVPVHISPDIAHSIFQLYPRRYALNQYLDNRPGSHFDLLST